MKAENPIPMQKFIESETLLKDELILKFADESFTLLDAVEFEVLSQNEPDIIDLALINRKIRQQIQDMPSIKAKPGFEERLQKRILNAETGS